MEISKEKVSYYSKRILMSRMRLLIKNGFYGILLMHTEFKLTDEVEIAGFQREDKGFSIVINPKTLDDTNDDELDFILMHEILHIALRHGDRGIGMDPLKYDKACDIVVNSNILKSCGDDQKSISLHLNNGVQEHLAPNGEEGYKYTVEQLYDLLEMPVSTKPIKSPGSQNSSKGQGSQNSSKGQGSQNSSKGHGSQNSGKGGRKGFDDHDMGVKTPVDNSDEIEEGDQVWDKYVADACEAISVRERNKSRGTIPLAAYRKWEEMRKPQTDWRSILNNFIQEEINDYSFTPPDRRFDDSPFFLPDFNEKDEIVKDILFMIDTSGSMSNTMITAAYSEIKGAIDQFNGKLKGWLGFFDAVVIDPTPFDNVEEFEIIRPKGGGGTDFEIIFEYVRDHMQKKLPASIIILTDGYAPFPDEKMRMDIPVLWLLNNNEVNPPWGKVTRITVE